jgi:hypothetical protein
MKLKFELNMPENTYATEVLPLIAAVKYLARSFFPTSLVKVSLGTDKTPKNNRSENLN